MIASETNALMWEDSIIDPSIDIKYLENSNVKLVYISHGHADHFRQAHFLRQKGALVLASKKETMFIQEPAINVRAMFSWAALPPAMVTRFFQGEACQVDMYTENAHDYPIQVIPLPGHSIGHVGFLLPSKVLYCGDALWQRKNWELFPLPYMIDIDQVRNSIDKIKNLEYKWLLPGHGELMSKEESMKDLDYELDKISEIEDIILEILVTPMNIEDLAKNISIKLHLIDRVNQYWLTLVVLKAFLCNLFEREIVDCQYEDYRALWKVKR